MWKSIAGYYRIEITCASPMDMLTLLNRLSVKVWDVRQEGGLVVSFFVMRIDYERLCAAVKHNGGNIKVLDRKGIYWIICSMAYRPILVAGMVLLIVLAMYLPTKVLFVRVEGNENVPASLIADSASKCGIHFGASRRLVRSEKVKNALLDAVPDLQWVGINTYGCVAVVAVKERYSGTKISAEHSVSKIVAVRDGVICEMTVLGGNPQCKVGQAVKKGQTLVSGYTDCGIVIKAEPSEAEIMAQTMRSLRVVTLTECLKRSDNIYSDVRYGLRIGKNIIKFDKDSGISDTRCVKMYREIKLTLPGGFVLPISLLVTRYSYYNCETSIATESEDFSWLNDGTQGYLNKQMISGQIVNKEENITMADGVCVLDGRYACLEMIGRVENEEFVGFDEERN